MKKYLIVGIIIIAAAVALALDARKIERLSAQLSQYRANTEALLTDVRTYKVRDSLNAARVQSLELSAREFERFRAEDAALIRELKGRNRELASVNRTQAQTIIDLMAQPRDTVIVRDSIPTPALAVHCGDAWYDFDGVVAPGEFSGKLSVRDSLIAAETVRYRKFLWWKLGVRDRRVDVISRNPHVTILNVEHILLTN